ncbi:MAG: hypothetical protein DCC55_09110 [Chloroflexi bacterium]|nr:MAG: hypothetical protein DCC55_09110 [Chloroflexota bacterium]
MRMAVFTTPKEIVGQHPFHFFLGDQAIMERCVEPVCHAVDDITTIAEKATKNATSAGAIIIFLRLSLQLSDILFEHPDILFEHPDILFEYIQISTHRFLTSRQFGEEFFQAQESFRGLSLCFSQFLQGFRNPESPIRLAL